MTNLKRNIVNYRRVKCCLNCIHMKEALSFGVAVVCSKHWNIPHDNDPVLVDNPEYYEDIVKYEREFEVDGDYVCDEHQIIQLPK